MPELEWYAESILQRSPSEYLRERLRVLAVSCANPDSVDSMAEHGATFGELDLRWVAVEDKSPKSEMAPSERFALMDSAVLLHQTAETLWHWFLAAMDAVPAPWFSIPSTSPSKLQSEIAAFGSETTEFKDDSVGRAFMDASELAGTPRRGRTAESAAAVGELRRLMVFFAEHVGSAGAYNGIKHGAAAVAGRQELTLEIGGETVGWASGESLIVLRRNGRPDRGREPWQLEQRWYSLEVCLAGTAMGCALLDLLWQRIRLRARGRGVREVAPGEVAGLTVARLRDLSDAHSSSAIRRFTWTPDAD